MQNPFANINFSTVEIPTRQERPDFFSAPGRIDAIVVDAKAGFSQNPKRQGEPFVLVTFECVKVHDGDYKPGDLRGWWKALRGEHNLRDVKMLGVALAECDPADIDSGMLWGMFDPAQGDGAPAIIGCTLQINIVQNRAGNTDKDGNLYVNCYFSPVSSGQKVNW